MEKAVLVVSEDPNDRAELNRCLCNRYPIIELEGLKQARETLTDWLDEICLVLADVSYARQKNDKMLAKLYRMAADRVPVLVFSRGSETGLEEEALAAGVQDVIRSPFLPAIVLNRVSNHIEMFAAREQNRCSSLHRDRTEGVFASIIENHNLRNQNHTARVRRYTEILLRAITYSDNIPHWFSEKQMMDIADAAALHDIGKIFVPESILQKPGPLTRVEFELVKLHTTKGYEMLQRLEGMEDPEFFVYCSSICLSHHERYDGSGYPEGLSGDRLPIEVQVVGIADVYDSLIQKLVYKDAIEHDKAVEMIVSGDCGSFEPYLVQCFYAVAEQFRSIAQQYAG